MNSLTRRFRGKIRQSRAEKLTTINEAVNLTTKFITSYFMDRQTFLTKVQEKSFDLLILSTIKDFDLALLNARHMLNLYQSQIRAVIIITPNPPQVSNLEQKIQLIDEGAFLQNTEIVKACDSFGERSSWIKQQYLKMRFVYDSDLPVLIIDADTFLVRGIFLFSDQEHTLLIGGEDYHYPYTSHCRDFFGTTQPLLNFVNHLQLQIPSYYHRIFRQNFDSDWIRWVSLGYKYGEDSPVSEFQTYAGALLGSPIHNPIIVPLIHETIDMGGKSIRDFEDSFSIFTGDLLTIGNKLLLRS